MDEDAFRAFYDRTSRGLCAYLARVTGDRALAEDLMQDAYYRFLRANTPYKANHTGGTPCFASRRIWPATPIGAARSVDLASLGDTDVPSRIAAPRRSSTRPISRERCSRSSRASARCCRLAYSEGCVAPGNRPADGALDRQREAAAVPRAASSGRDPHGAARSGGPPGRRTVIARECVHEADVLTAISTRRWPNRAAARARRARGRLCHLRGRARGRLGVRRRPRTDAADAASARCHPRLDPRADARARRSRAGRRAAHYRGSAIGLATGVGVMGAVFGASATWFSPASARRGRPSSRSRRFSRPPCRPRSSRSWPRTASSSSARSPADSRSRHSSCF